MEYQHALLITALCGLLAAGEGALAVPPEEAAKLKTTLTPFGAERAGNKEGTIPAWEGGYTKVPPGYKSGDPRPDPFAGEKPLFSITAKNVDQYADKLAQGVKALLKRYPTTYRLDVYPTHRSAAAPQWVYDNTFKNATRAKTTNSGLTLVGAYGGVPFPIPKDGYEAIWNHLLVWRGEAARSQFRTYVVISEGKRVLATEGSLEQDFVYFTKDGSLEKFNGDHVNIRVTISGPPFKAGEAFLIKDPVDQLGKGRQAWQYLTGQRRVRKAPSLSYDTPDFVTSGIANVDEVFVFFGALDRYEWKLVRKQEMYIPYNNNRLVLANALEVVTPNHLNPDYVRWELHRVWVVEATLAPGKRHTVPKRRFYLDEDTWAAILADEWDAQGQLWKFAYLLPFVMSEIPAVLPQMYGVHNLQTGTYVVNGLLNESPIQYQLSPHSPPNHFSPEALAGEGVR